MSIGKIQHYVSWVPGRYFMAFPTMADRKRATGWSTPAAPMRAGHHHHSPAARVMDSGSSPLLRTMIMPGLRCHSARFRTTSRLRPLRYSLNVTFPRSCNDILGCHFPSEVDSVVRTARAGCSEAEQRLSASLPRPRAGRGSGPGQLIRGDLARAIPARKGRGSNKARRR